MTSTLKSFLPVLMVIASVSHAQLPDRLPVENVKPLLQRAIDQGYAYGFLIGPSAIYIRKTFGTDARVEMDVRALHALPESGCSRLQVTTRQKAVSERGRLSDKEFSYQVSYCRDGRFPTQK